MPPHEPIGTFTELPDPGAARSVGELVERLRRLKVWAGDPSYEQITARIAAGWTAEGRPAAEFPAKNTVADCFKAGRRRLNPDLIVAVVTALHPDVGYVAQWRQALRVIGGEARAAGQVRVEDRLPPDLAGFTGRAAELAHLRRVLGAPSSGAGGPAIAAIAGMAGVGKTQLAVHLGHRLVRDERFERVLFVNLRGFHPDPAQPPADPGAVLDGFLRLLDVPGQQIPHDLTARAAAYRERLAGTRTLVLLDNAADANQVRPLLPGPASGPGCAVLVTGRRELTDLDPATHLTVNAFTPAEARRYLSRAASGVPVGADPGAAARIADRCGHLPLALGLVTGHIRGKPGWTLTDHADRLDTHRDQGRVDTGVHVALGLSYQQLTTAEQRLLRLIAVHPGQDLDPYAAAALAGADLGTTRTHLRRLRDDHLLQPAGHGRYTLHDLVRAYAAGRTVDDDPPPERRAALTRLFDFYLATAAAAMDALHPGEAHRRPRVPPAATPAPRLTDPGAALAWLDSERPTLVAVAAHTATQGWPEHATRLSTTLFRYLANGYFTDALTVHGHAGHAAKHAGDLAGQAQALANLGATHMQMGRYGPAVDQLHQALHRFRQTGDEIGQARTLGNLGIVRALQCRFPRAADHHEQALALFRRAGDRIGEARALDKLAELEGWLGFHDSAAGHHEQALALFRLSGDQAGEAHTLTNLGDVEVRQRRYRSAAEHLQQALALCRQLGDRIAEAGALDSIGVLHTRLGQPGQAAANHRQALTILEELGDRFGESWALNGLGEAATAAGDPVTAVTHHTAALAIATDLDDRKQTARAHAGLAQAHQALGDPDRGRRHYRRALALYTGLGIPEADELRTRLGGLEDTTAAGRRTPPHADRRPHAASG